MGDYSSPLTEAFHRAGFSIKKLSEQTRICRQTLTRMAYGRQSAVRFHVKERLAPALGLTVDELDGLIFLTRSLARPRRRK
jgi:DNA-binding Xre family transcriptional regulator